VRRRPCGPLPAPLVISLRPLRPPWRPCGPLLLPCGPASRCCRPYSEKVHREARRRGGEKVNFALTSPPPRLPVNLSSSPLEGDHAAIGPLALERPRRERGAVAVLVRPAVTLHQERAGLVAVALEGGPLDGRRVARPADERPGGPLEVVVADRQRVGADPIFDGQAGDEFARAPLGGALDVSDRRPRRAARRRGRGRP